MSAGPAADPEDVHAIVDQAGWRRWPAFWLRRPDAFFVTRTRAADHPAPWIAVSAVLAAGGRQARSGAIRGLAAVAVTSAVSNSLLKPVFPLRLSVPASNPDDRQLDILTVEDLPPSHMLLAAVPVLLRGTRPVPGISIRHAARVRVRADDPLEVTLDGEIAGTLPGSFEVAGEALRVITPLSFVDIDDNFTEGRTE